MTKKMLRIIFCIGLLFVYFGESATIPPESNTGEIPDEKGTSLESPSVSTTASVSSAMPMKDDSNLEPNMTAASTTNTSSDVVMNSTISNSTNTSTSIVKNDNINENKATLQPVTDSTTKTTNKPTSKSSIPLTISPKTLQPKPAMSDSSTDQGNGSINKIEGNYKDNKENITEQGKGNDGKENSDGKGGDNDGNGDDNKGGDDGKVDNNGKGDNGGREGDDGKGGENGGKAGDDGKGDNDGKGGDDGKGDNDGKGDDNGGKGGDDVKGDDNGGKGGDDGKGDNGGDKGSDDGKGDDKQKNFEKVDDNKKDDDQDKVNGNGIGDKGGESNENFDAGKEDEEGKKTNFNEDGNIEKEKGDAKESVFNRHEISGGVKKVQEVPYEEESPGAGHFMAYFLTAVVLCVAGYVIFHNKQKIVAFIVEGRNGRRSSRRPNKSGYKKLTPSGDDVLPKLEKSTSSSQYIY